MFAIDHFNTAIDVINPFDPIKGTKSKKFNRFHRSIFGNVYYFLLIVPDYHWLLISNWTFLFNAVSCCMRRETFNWARCYLGSTETQFQLQITVTFNLAHRVVFPQQAFDICGLEEMTTDDFNYSDLLLLLSGSEESIATFCQMFTLASLLVISIYLKPTALREKF